MTTRGAPRKIARALIGMAPGMGAIPGAIATVAIAAPSCGFALTELQTLYPSASGLLQTVTVVGALVWVLWAVLFFRIGSWSSAVDGATIAGRLTTVGSLLGGLAIGTALSLVAYAAVSGVEDMCEPVMLPIGLLWFLILVGPVFVVYVVVEAALDAKRRGAAS